MKPNAHVKYDTKKTNSKDYLYPVDTSMECFSVKYSQNDLYLGCGYASGKIAILDVGNNYKMQASIRASEFAITGLRFRGDSSVMCVSADGRIGTYHTKTGKVLHILEEPNNPLMCLDINNSNTQFAVGGNDKVVKLYDDETKTLISELKGNYSQVGHSNRIFSVNFHKTENNLLCSGGWDSIVVFYDVRQKEIIGNVLGPHICGDALDMKGNYLLTGSWKVKEQIKIFDIRKFALVETVKWEYHKDDYTSYLYAAQFSKSSGTKNDYFAVGGSHKNMFRVYDNSEHCSINDKGEKDRSVFCHDDVGGAVYSLDFSNSLINKIAVGCGDGIVRIYDINDIGVQL